MQLVSALEQAVMSHTKKHYYAGFAAGIKMAVEDIQSKMTESERAHLLPILIELALKAEDAKTKSLDGRPTG